MNEINTNHKYINNEINKYYCNVCDYRCSKQSEWKRHISRIKHKNEVNEVSLCKEIIINKADL